jgi:hypothetical protein
MLRIDLLNEIRNEKYFAEIELNRLAQSMDIPYKEKLVRMGQVLKTIDSANRRTELVKVYFGDESVQQVANKPTPAPVPEAEDSQPVARRAPIEGQSHGE